MAEARQLGPKLFLLLISQDQNRCRRFIDVACLSKHDLSIQCHYNRSQQLGFYKRRGELNY